MISDYDVSFSFFSIDKVRSFCGYLQIFERLIDGLLNKNNTSYICYRTQQLTQIN